MTVRSGNTVAAGLSRVALMDRKERAHTIRQLRQQNSTFRSLLSRVTLAKTVAFVSALVLAVAVMSLAYGVAVWLISTLILGGLVGFGYVAVTLSDTRFDLLLAVLGAHRTDELHGELITEQIYGVDSFPEPEPVSAPASARVLDGSDEYRDATPTAEITQKR